MNVYQLNKYQEGKIYKIVCNITGEIYIGSTVQTLKKRLKGHESGYRFHVKKGGSKTSSFQIIERGDYKIELIIEFPCESRVELEMKEGSYQLSLKCVNKLIARRSPEDMCIASKKYRKQYRLDNYEKLYNYGMKRITCCCGKSSQKNNISRHRNSRFHKKYIDQKNIEIMEIMNIIY